MWVFVVLAGALGGFPRRQEEKPKDSFIKLIKEMVSIHKVLTWVFCFLLEGRRGGCWG